MKKIISVVLMVLMILSFTACSNNNNIEEQSEGFRSIVVADFTGDVDVTRFEGDKLGAYKGLSLFNGDDVKVAELSDLTLDVDTDKHLYAEEKTHFWLEATGEEGNSKTRIHLAEGSVLCRVEKALTADEIFEVVTDTSTMSVRGTVFGITILRAEDGTIFEVVRVYDGKVATKIEGTEAFVTIEPGQCAVIKEAEEGSGENDAFVVAEALTDEFWENPTGDVETIKEGESPIVEIDYTILSSAYINQLIEMAEDGEELVIDTEKLEEVKEIVVEKEEQKAAEETAAKQEEIKEETKVEEKKTEAVVEEVNKKENTTSGNTSSGGGTTTGSGTTSGGGNDEEDGQANQPTDPASSISSYRCTKISLSDSAVLSGLSYSNGTFTIVVDAIAKVDAISDDGTVVSSTNEPVVVELYISESSGTIAGGLVSSTSDLINSGAVDINNCLVGGYFERSSKLTDYINNHYKYSVNIRSNNVDSYSKNESGVVESITFKVPVSRFIIDDNNASSDVISTDSDAKLIGSNPQINGTSYSFTYSFENSNYSDLNSEANKEAEYLNGLASSYIVNKEREASGSSTNSFANSVNYSPEHVSCTITFNTNKNNIVAPQNKTVYIGEEIGSLEMLPQCINEDGTKETFTYWYDKTGAVVDEKTVITQDLYNNICDPNTGYITLHAGWTGQN